MYRKSLWMNGNHQVVIKSVDVFEDLGALRFLDHAFKNDDVNSYLSPAFLKAVMTTYSFKGWYFICVRDQELFGAASFYAKPNFFGRNILTTVPGGFWARDGEAQRMLVNRSNKLAVHNKLNGPFFKDLGSQMNELGTPKTGHRAVIHLPGRKEDLKRLFRKNIRRDIRMAEKKGIKVAESSDLRQFYQVWSARMRDLGTPAVPFAFFENMKSFFRDNMLLLLAKKEGKCIGGVVLLKQGKSMMDPYLGCLSEALKFCTAPFLYYKMLCLAVEQGYRFFDLGRSQPGSGNEKFKLRFGAKLEPLYSYTEENLIETDGPFGNMITYGWKHVPLPVANMMGPGIRRYMPFG